VTFQLQCRVAIPVFVALAQGFDLLDPILQRRIQLRETACNPGLRLRRGAVPDLFSHLGRKIQPRMK